MNDYLERKDIVERNRKYKEELDRMIELRDQGKKNLKDQEVKELKEREKESKLLDHLERENKTNFKTRNNDMISKCLEEQNQLQDKAKEMKRMEELEFHRRLQEMKEQELLAKQQQKEYRDLRNKDLQDSYQIMKQVRTPHADQRHRERERERDGPLLRQERERNDREARRRPEQVFRKNQERFRPEPQSDRVLQPPVLGLGPAREAAGRALGGYPCPREASARAGDRAEEAAGEGGAEPADDQLHQEPDGRAQSAETRLPRARHARDALPDGPSGRTA